MSRTIRLHVTTIRNRRTRFANLNPPLTGNWSVYRQHADGTRELIEAGLPEEIARQMVADYAAEGETSFKTVEE